VRTLEQLADQRPNDGGLVYLIGGAKWKSGDLNGARVAFEKAIRLDPKNKNARIAYATVSLEEGRESDALDTARRLQQDFPDDPTGLVLEGNISLQQKRPELAVKALEAAYALKKTAAGVLALTRAYAESQQRSKAITVLQSWVAEHQDDYQALGSLALLQQQDGREREAIASYERLIGAGKANFIVLNNLAWLYQQAGDARALDVAKQAYDLDSNRPEVADTYGWVLLKSGKVDEALSILQQAYVSYPTQTEIGFHVAIALKEAGRGDEAVKVLRRLLRETPNFERAEEAKALLAELEK
jgi:tetratricopeptide (TPR) repeat protein